ncbi:hypothetical protein ACFMPD_15660 [Sedimentitalea sp. HM32M-2]|uniref:hypothetical protein n=1 Tax=Sedimentitalea sp. HM32M-2 TaxID=3351566 RepID=UPI003642FE6B
MTPEEIEAHFTRSDGGFAFARWGRPIVPIVFGVKDQTLPVIKGAFQAVCALAGHQMAETDPELGSNCMLFFFRNWEELTEVPDLDRLVPDLGPLVARLKSADASQYRVFRFDRDGAIKAAFVFLRMQGDLARQPAETLALGQVVQTMLLWSDRAFAERSPLAMAQDTVILRPDIAGLIRAAYDPVLPVAAQDASHALRLFARMGTAS